MTETRFPESFLTDPRIDNLSDAAFRVYVNGEIYSVSHGTDGALTGRALRFLHPEGPDQRSCGRSSKQAYGTRPRTGGRSTASCLVRRRRRRWNRAGSLPGSASRSSESATSRRRETKLSRVTDSVTRRVTAVVTP